MPRPLPRPGLGRITVPEGGVREGPVTLRLPKEVMKFVDEGLARDGGVPDGGVPEGPPTEGGVQVPPTEVPEGPSEQVKRVKQE